MSAASGAQLRGEDGMVDRIKVQLVQINNSYSNQYYLPYVAGILAVTVGKIPDLADLVDFPEFIFRREPPEAIAERIGKVDVLGVSCYVWNWRLSVAVAEAVRRRNPDALIVFGGPHVPDVGHDAEFLIRNPVIDVAVHGEGEVSFVEILRAVRDGTPLSEIAGLTVRDRNTGTVASTAKRTRMRDLSGLPSPYTEGVFDSLIQRYPDFEWMTIWETNRGCPFSCTYCDWGSAIASKVTEFDWDRLAAEIEWFSVHKIRYVFCADANFGIRKRDIEIAQALVAAKKKNDYPKDFRVCFTKNSTDKIFDLATTFHEADMLRGVSLSMQSLDSSVLQLIKRDNISIQVFRDLQSRYNKANVSTFTEIIIGLPGETFDSFVDGLVDLLDNGQHSQILIYNCTVMPNAEMGDPVYRDKHGIKTVEIPIFALHSVPGASDDPLIEKEQIIVETASMSRGDWRRMYRVGWCIQLFHTLGLLQGTAITLHHGYGVSYRDLYLSLISWAQAQPDSLIGREIKILDEVLDRVLAGIGFDQILPEFSDITWPAEEASLLRFSLAFDDFYAEVRKFLGGFVAERHIDVNEALLDDMIKYQRAAVVDPFSAGDVSLALSANLPESIAAWRICQDATLTRGTYRYRVQRTVEYGGDVRAYAKLTVWYGRKGGKYLLPIERDGV